MEASWLADLGISKGSFVITSFEFVQERLRQQRAHGYTLAFERRLTQCAPEFVQLPELLEQSGNIPVAVAVSGFTLWVLCLPKSAV